MSTSSNNEDCVNDGVAVIFVQKHDAKMVKNALEKEGWMDKNYRMTAAAQNQDWVSIPVLQSFCVEDFVLKQSVQGVGNQPCPFSSSVLGNPSKQHIMIPSQQLSQWSPLKQALLFAIQTFFGMEEDNRETYTKIQSEIANLSATTCPSKLEYLGDDRNLVLPASALLNKDVQQLLQNALNFDCNDPTLFLQELWKQVANAYHSPRILRKGGVDPNSRIRQTGYQLLWPNNASSWITVTEQGIRQSFDVTQVMFSRGNISEKIRWGTQLVQEGDVVLDLYAGIGYYTLPALLQGRAAYVYACEWNPEALKALKHNVRDNGVEDRVSILAGDCRKVVLPLVETGPINRVSLGLLPSSEGGWKTAVQALLRTLPRESDSVLSNQLAGGWLHVHGNVPVKERIVWAQWLVRCLYKLLVAQANVSEVAIAKDWIVACHHVEKVKSFAPTVNHYVADVFLGTKATLSVQPQLSQPQQNAILYSRKDESCFLYNAKTQAFEGCPIDISPPSCALSSDGALHQQWMRSTDPDDENQ